MGRGGRVPGVHFERARRQHLLVAGAVEAVRDRGLGSLSKLSAIGDRFVKTDLALGSASRLFQLVAKADLRGSTRIVFGPTKWAIGGPGTSFSPRLDVIRTWTAEWMAPVSG